MAWGIASVIRRISSSSCRNFSSVRLRFSISVFVPYHLTMLAELVTQRFNTEQEPAIFTVVPPQAVFDLTRLP